MGFLCTHAGADPGLGSTPARFLKGGRPAAALSPHQLSPHHARHVLADVAQIWQSTKPPSPLRSSAASFLQFAGETRLWPSPISVKPASWFHGQAQNQYAVEDTGQFADWLERSVNTSLGCAEPGCTARALLQVFNPSVEEAQNCRLGLHVRPTDFDDVASGERVEWIAANDRTVASDCFPQQNSCNEADGIPLLQCLMDYPVDSLIDSAGTLTVAAKIAHVVDECPYEGNLLSAIPAVTCMVQKKKERIEPTVTVVPANVSACQRSEIRVHAFLRCLTRGCVAETVAKVNSTPVTQCLLSVYINQTDFDGPSEVLESFNVSSDVMLADVQPGQNPCGCQTTRPNVPLEPYTLMEDEDITSYVGSNGTVSLSAKIGDLVDECPSNGFLLDAMAEIVCTLEC